MFAAVCTSTCKTQNTLNCMPERLIFFSCIPKKTLCYLRLMFCFLPVQRGSEEVNKGIIKLRSPFLGISHLCLCVVWLATPTLHPSHTRTHIQVIRSKVMTVPSFLIIYFGLGAIGFNFLPTWNRLIPVVLNL